MRIVFRGASTLLLVLIFANCSGLLKKGEDAGAEASAEVASDAAATPTPAPAALATNEGDVARFPDEAKLADEAAVLQRTFNVREAPPNGTIVAGLVKGTAVTKIASRDRFFLITFADPKGSGSKLMGWVSRDAFSAVIPDAGPLVCGTGEIALFADTPFCGKVCSSDGDCPGGQACKGSAAKLLANGKAGDNVTVCTVFHARDAGAAPVVVDAGPARVDAGPAPVDAGPAPASDVVAPVGGKCPANFLLVAKTNKCHRPCPAGPTGGECKNKSPFCIKCDKDEKKVCAESKEQCK
jgi:hypothetical protein